MSVNKIAKKSMGSDQVSFEFVDGTGVQVKLGDFSDELIVRAALHGLGQKLGDSYSGMKSLAEAKAAFNAVLESLKQGDWNRKGGSSGGVWVLAFAEVVGKPFEEVLAKWNEMDEAARKAVKNHPDVKLAKAKIDLDRAAKAASGDDVAELTL